MEEIVNRFKSESPDFWKKIRKWAVIVGAISGGAAASFATAGLAVPAWVTWILLTIASSSATLAGGATLTKK